MSVGILALQGCVEQHAEHLKKIGIEPRKVRNSQDLEKVERIILPGGESSAMLLLLKKSFLWEPLKNFVKNRPSWGICAGAILLAAETTNPSQDSLAAIPIRACRNFYGSQLNSFSTELKIDCLNKKIRVDFIRAPRLEVIGNGPEILATYNDSPVLIKHDKTMVSAFHTELGEDSSLHRYFAEL